jgi:STE24 endopeptidase
MFTFVFLAALFVSLAVKVWLAQRQMHHVTAHRNTVPQRFHDVMPLAAHQKAADYTIARTQIGTAQTLVEAALLIGLTLAGGIQWADEGVARLATDYGWPPLVQQITLVVAVLVISAVIDLPFSIYRQFVLEARFGFNQMTWTLYLADLAKMMLLSALMGIPLLAIVLYLMSAAGSLWWLYAWLVWSGFNLLIQLLYPSLIAPLFNRFAPLDDQPLRERIESLLRRCGFAAKGVFVMDGSRRSTHGNAYFTGFGATKRIVFFDTLLARLSPQEIEAVLAHELGHFKRHHVIKRIGVSFALSFAGLALLGWLIEQAWFFEGLGVDPTVISRNAVALLLFFSVMPVFTFLLGPLFSLASRKHEFEADAFAAEHTAPAELVHALVKLYEDNASTLTPDPLHSVFYDSHPPAALRIERLDAFAT